MTETITEPAPGERPRRRRRRRRSRRRRIVRALLVLIVVTPLIGWLYEQYAVRRDARRFPPPGQFVQVDPGRRLHYICSGSGNPLVLFEVSGFSNSTSFEQARSALARDTRVCSYDRRGIGWSDPAPSKLPVSLLADDLAKLLDELSPGEPAIVVASSIGGVTAEYLARQNPGRVAGLVLLDAANSYSVRGAMKRRELILAARVGCGVVRVAGAFALVRLLDPWHLRGRTDDVGRSAALMYGAKPWVMLCGMLRAADATLNEFDESPALKPAMPVTALSAASDADLLPPMLAGWIHLRGSVDALHESHQRMAQSSTHGVWRMVPGSSHLIASSKPQAAIDAVTDMITLSGRPSAP